jgi:hypothetical protein
MPAWRVGEIIQAFNMLETLPLIDCPAPRGKRELIIGLSACGDVAVPLRVRDRHGLCSRLAQPAGGWIQEKLR